MPPLSKPAWPDRPALFVASKSIDEWALPETLVYSGLLLRRPFDGKFDSMQAAIDEAAESKRFGESQALTAVASNKSPRLFEQTVNGLLDRASFPAKLSDQVRKDACTMGKIWGELCPEARELEVKLEIFGENTCARWHQDHFVGRAICSYTGATGTSYTRNSNVNFWELENCGNNNCIIHDKERIESVAVGDMLLIKGTKYPQLSSAALVHKSPDKRYDTDGRILNRLVLKVDLITPPPPAQSKGKRAKINQLAQGIMRSLVDVSQ